MPRNQLSWFITPAEKTSRTAEARTPVPEKGCGEDNQDQGVALSKQ
jgi:hypothetical protein